MAEEQNAAQPEIVIIRRRGGEDLTAAKGGAWKIAYADFVTAMMAFFLVMWLINAANEATRAQVASYFNPIKLTDSSTGGKGLNDPKEVKNKKSQPGVGGEAAAGTSEKAEEEKVLADPAATLDRIAGYAEAKEAIQLEAASEKQRGVTDPFDPMVWQAAPEKPAEASPQEWKKSINEETRENGGQSQKIESSPQLEDKPGSAEKALGGQSTPKLADLQESPKQMADDHENGAEKAAREVNARKIKLAAEVKKEILQALKQQPEMIPATIEVEGTDEGLLVSLVDKSDDGMFNVGSAEPSEKLIELVATIAQVLRNHEGFIVIRGHTDSRPYRNRRFDNWQLSTARAHMAYYMLVRGGLDELRVRRVEGLADRDPKIPERPEAPENRRIDILLGQE